MSLFFSIIKLIFSMSFSILILMMILSVSASNVKGPIIINLSALGIQAEISPQGETVMVCSKGGNGI